MASARTLNYNMESSQAKNFLYVYLSVYRFLINITFPLFFAIHILTKEIIFPALAAAWDEEPVVVEPHVVAAQLVLAVAVDLRLTRPLEQVLVVVTRGRGLE